MEHAQTQHVFDYANVSMVIFIEPIYATDTDHDSARTEQLKDEMGAITFYRGSSFATRRTLGNSIIIAPKEDTYSRVGRRWKMTTTADVNNNTVGIGKLLWGFGGLTEYCAGY